MKKLYRGIFVVLLIILVISTFQDLSARQNDPGQPCDPDAVAPDPLACPIDTNVVFLIIGGVGLYLFAGRGLIKSASF